MFPAYPPVNGSMWAWWTHPWPALVWGPPVRDAFQQDVAFGVILGGMFLTLSFLGLYPASRPFTG